MSGPHKVFSSSSRVISSVAPITVQVLILTPSLKSLPCRVWSRGKDPAPARRAIRQGHNSVVLNHRPCAGEHNARKTRGPPDAFSYILPNSPQRCGK